MSSKKGLDNKRSRETLKRILKYISQYKWSVILSLLLAFITVALTLYVPILTGRAVDLYGGAGRFGYCLLCDVVGANHLGTARRDLPEPSTCRCDGYLYICFMGR